MSRCDTENCSGSAVVHIAYVEGDTTREAHLCEQCAAKHEPLLQRPSGWPMGDVVRLARDRFKIIFQGEVLQEERQYYATPQLAASSPLATLIFQLGSIRDVEINGDSVTVGIASEAQTHRIVGMIVHAVREHILRSR